MTHASYADVPRLTRVAPERGGNTPAILPALRKDSVAFVPHDLALSYA